MLQKAVAGKTVYLATPLGSLPIRFRIDGTMSGKGGDLASYTGSAQGPLVGGRRKPLPALADLAERQDVLLHPAPAGQDGSLGAKRRYERQGHHYSIKARGAALMEFQSLGKHLPGAE